MPVQQPLDLEKQLKPQITSERTSMNEKLLLFIPPTDNPVIPLSYCFTGYTLEKIRRADMDKVGAALVAKASSVFTGRWKTEFLLMFH